MHSFNLQSITLLLILIQFGVMGYPQPSRIYFDEAPSSSDHTCPPPTDRAKPERYHVPSGKCFRINTKGPCENNLIFYKTEDGDGKTYGDCDCPLGSEIPWIYHEQTNKCYKAYEQGYCSTGQWLVFDDDEPKCVSNECSNQLASASPDTKIVFYKGQCVTLFESSSVCQSNEIVSFATNDVNPSCVVGQTADYNIAKTSQLKCKPGTRRDIVGKCRTAIQSQSAFMKIGR